MGGRYLLLFIQMGKQKQPEAKLAQGSLQKSLQSQAQHPLLQQTDRPLVALSDECNPGFSICLLVVVSFLLGLLKWFGPLTIMVGKAH